MRTNTYVHMFNAQELRAQVSRHNTLGVEIVCISFGDNTTVSLTPEQAAALRAALGGAL